MNVKEIFTNNAGLKALSLLLAAALWFSLTSRLDGEVRLKVPVVLKNLPAQLTVADTPPPLIELDVSGPKIVLLGLSKKRLTALLDLQGAGEGPVSFTSLDRTVHLPSGLRVIRVQPAQIELKLVKMPEQQQTTPKP